MMGENNHESNFITALTMDTGVNRRKFLSLGATVASILPAAAMGQAPDFWSLPRFLWLERQTPAGRETFRGFYFANGLLIPKAYAQICYILRDVRAGQMAAMSPVLLDILCGVQGVARSQNIDQPLFTTSGLRIEETNAITEGAARGSLHKEARAWDGTLLGYSAASIGEVAKYLRGGGVGIYPSRRFVHIDDGRLRSWRG